MIIARERNGNAYYYKGAAVSLSPGKDTPNAGGVGGGKRGSQDRSESEGSPERALSALWAQKRPLSDCQGHLYGVERGRAERDVRLVEKIVESPQTEEARNGGYLAV